MLLSSWRDAILRLLAILLVLGACLDARAEKKPKRIKSKECVECHEPVLQEAKRKTVHTPFKDSKNCESCHRRHGVVGTLVLQKAEPELCLECHADRKADLTKPHVHEAVQGGGCTACHAPHSSENAKLLTQPERELCFTCHDSKPCSGDLGHKPGKVDCTSCHSPHGSTEANLLLRPAKELCVGCHSAGG